MGLFDKKPKMSQEEFERKMREADARDAKRGPETTRGSAAAADFSTGAPPAAVVTPNAAEPTSKSLQGIKDYSSGQKGVTERRMREAGQ